MQGTSGIYEKPSLLAQGLVVGLSIAVVAMAGWFITTVLLGPAAMTSGDSDAAEASVNPQAEPASGAAADRQGQTTRSVQFDWPAEFSAASAPAAAAPPAQTALPLAQADLPAGRDLSRAAWPGAAVDRGLPAASPGGAASEASDAIMDVLTPPSPRPGAKSPGGKAASSSSAPPQRQVQQQVQQQPQQQAQPRRQKPRTDNSAAIAQ